MAKAGQQTSATTCPILNSKFDSAQEERLVYDAWRGKFLCCFLSNTLDSPVSSSANPVSASVPASGGTTPAHQHSPSKGADSSDTGHVTTQLLQVPGGGHGRTQSHSRRTNSTYTDDSTLTAMTSAASDPLVAGGHRTRTSIGSAIPAPNFGGSPQTRGAGGSSGPPWFEVSRQHQRREIGVFLQISVLSKLLHVQDVHDVVCFACEETSKAELQNQIGLSVAADFPGIALEVVKKGVDDGVKVMAKSSRERRKTLVLINTLLSMSQLVSSCIFPTMPSSRLATSAEGRPGGGRPASMPVPGTTPPPNVAGNRASGTKSLICMDFLNSSIESECIHRHPRTILRRKCLLSASTEPGGPNLVRFYSA